MGQTDEALKTLDQSLAIKPDHVATLCDKAILLRWQGRYREALGSFADALRISPHDQSILNDTGLLLHETGQFDEAIAAYEQALSVNPKNPIVLYNKGNALRALNNNAGAAACYEQAIALRPDHYKALTNQGIALQALNRPAEALISYARALALKPDSVEVLLNRGAALRALNRLGEAVADYDRALLLNPDHPEVLNNRGNVLLDLKRAGEALACFERALAFKPDYPEAHNNRGNALVALARAGEALASYDRALALNPDYAEALYDRGTALHLLNRHTEALASFDRALAIKPDYAEAIYNRGISLQTLGRHDEAIASYGRALAVKPDHPHAFGALFHQRQQICDWFDLENRAATLSEHVTHQKSLIAPFTLISISLDPAEQLLCARQCVADQSKNVEPLPWRCDRYAHSRIRIAYLSADFRHHAIAVLMAGLFERHDRSRFEVMGISIGPDDGSATRARLQAGFDQFIDARDKSDLEVARGLRDNEIDIAVDLQGHTKDARLNILSYRPAPIQVNYLGYPGTMGADYIDYILADEFVIPVEHQVHYTEKVVYLPDTYQPNDSKRSIPAHTPTRTEAGLPQHGFVICCFNNNFKITPGIFDAWMRLLIKVEGSVLWLLEDNATASSNLRREARVRGVAPGRLIFAPRVSLDEHLARHRLAGLFLDTLPYNAHTTASDALWAGLPLLTCPGTTFPGRVAASLLNAVGAPELITHNLEDYEALALKLATTPDMLADIKSKLARNRTIYPLFDTDRFRCHIEAAYRTMWEIWQNGESPRSFAVKSSTA